MDTPLLLLPTFCRALLISTSSNAQTTTTTTTTNPDGSVTTQEVTTQEPAAQPTTGNSRNVVGPAGVTGTIRRVNRRDEYRQNEDLDDLEDALEDRPRPRR